MQKIRKSLTIKVFIMTVFILVIVCGMTYAMVYHFVPRTNVNITENKFQTMVSAFPHKSVKECREQLTSFKKEYNVDADMEGIDVEGTGVQQFTSIIGIQGKTVHFVDLSDDLEFRALDGYENEGVAVKEYVVRVAEADAYYYVTLELDNKQVNQITYAFQKLLPWLVMGVLIMSVLVSLLYARYITKPVLTLASVSMKMANMENESQATINRTDEIGTLADNLNYLYTQLKDNIVQLENSNKELTSEVEREREMAQIRQRFFSAVSHELKTPITIVKGQLEGMIGQVGEYQNRDMYLQKSYDVMCKMEGLVQEIIYLSKLETVNVDAGLFTIERINFSELIRGELADKIELLEKKQMQLEVDVADDIYIEADQKSMEKVISNLYGNAIAYSKEGANIHVTLSREDDVVHFSIENSGVHIEEDSIPDLFKAFYRLEQSRNSATGGSGLGLYIVKTILMKHGIDYSMSNTDTGVKFSFCIK